MNKEYTHFIIIYPSYIKSGNSKLFPTANYIRRFVIKIINAKMSIYSRSSEFPLISGIRLSKVEENLEIKLSNGQIINDDNSVLVYIPYSWYVEYEQYITSTGKTTI